MMQKPKRYESRHLLENIGVLPMKIESICNDMLEKGYVLKETIAIPCGTTKVNVILIFAEY